jgi:hypothetical protein
MNGNGQEEEMMGSAHNRSQKDDGEYGSHQSKNLLFNLI